MLTADAVLLPNLTEIQGGEDEQRKGLGIQGRYRRLTRKKCFMVTTQS